MTETAFPFAPGAPAGSAIGAAQWRQWMLRQNGTPGVFPFGGMLAPSVGSGRNVVFADGEAAACGCYYNNDAPITLSFGANSSGQARYDYVVVAFDWIAQTAALTVIAGTPGSPPPALTQDAVTAWQLGVAIVHVAPSAVNILAGDLYPLLDRFASAPGAMPVGTVISWPGAETACPPGRALAAGQSINTLQIPKLAAILPAWSSGMQYGNNGATCIMPDTRGRIDAGPDDLGVAAGVASQAHRLNHPSGGSAAGAMGNQDLAPGDVPRPASSSAWDNLVLLDAVSPTGYLPLPGTPNFAPYVVGDPGWGNGQGSRVQPTILIPKLVVLC